MAKQKRRGHGEGTVYQRKDGRWVDDVPESFGVELTLKLAIIVFPHIVHIVPNKPSNATTTAEVNHTFFLLILC